MRVVLVEDHSLVRAGIRSLLEDVPTIEVVGEASRGSEGLELVETLRPDVVVLDISMPGTGGLEVLDRMTTAHPGVRVIMLSMHDEDEYVRDAVRAGAAGYLLKNSSLRELELAILSVAGGGSYLTPVVARHVLERFVDQGEGGRLGRQLTARHREIVRHIANGRTNREMAHLLGVSTKTVEGHRQELMDRLGIHDVAGLVRYALKVGLADPSE